MKEEINTVLSDINNIFDEIDDIYDHIIYDRCSSEYLTRGVKGNLKHLEVEEINVYLKKILPELIEVKRIASNMLDNARDYKSSVDRLVIKIDDLITGV